MALWLVLLLGGILLQVGGLFLTRLTWRHDVEPFGRGSPLLQLIIHPERFARPDHLRLIRLLNLFAAVLLAGAVVVVASEIVSVTFRQG